MLKEMLVYQKIFLIFGNAMLPMTRFPRYRKGMKDNDGIALQEMRTRPRGAVLGTLLGFVVLAEVITRGMIKRCS